MNFYESFYELTTLLPERERQKVNTALLDYFFTGREPSGLSESGMKVYRGCEGRIAASRANRENGAKGGAATQAGNRAKRRAALEAERQARAQAGIGAKRQAAHAVSSRTEGEGEGEKEKEKESESSARARFAPPTLREVSDYAAEYCRGKRLDPGGFDAERFIDHYTTTGWRVGKARMRDWRASVRNWCRSDCKQEGGSEYGCYDR